MKRGLAILLVIVSMGAYSKDFGVVGEVFPVREKSLLTLIYERLKSLDNEAFERSVKARVSAHVNRPQPLSLTRAQASKSHIYEPKTTLGVSLYDAKGGLLFPKGTSVNALHEMPWYQPCWLFIDADDKAQIVWATKNLKEHPNAKLILTKGAINKAEAAFNRPIYFDQEGRITQKLMIQQVPSRVTRKDDVLLIEEIYIKENGYEI